RRRSAPAGAAVRELLRGPGRHPVQRGPGGDRVAEEGRDDPAGYARQGEGAASGDPRPRRAVRAAAVSVAELQQQENVRAWFAGAHHDELPEADQQRYLAALDE